jgi:ABC-type phosphate transport system permease subunit
LLIYCWSAKADPTDATMSFSNSAASAGLVLLGLVLLFNIVAIMMRARFEKRRVGQ